MVHQIFEWFHGGEEIVVEMACKEVSVGVTCCEGHLEVYMPLDEAIRLGEVLVKLKE